jgi:hypothetical protein
MWELKAAVARERVDDLARDAAARRAAREASGGADTEDRQPLALDSAEVYPDDPAEGRATRGRAASPRRG